MGRLRRFIRRDGAKRLRRPIRTLFGLPPVGPPLFREKKGRNQTWDPRHEMESVDGASILRSYGTISRVPGTILQMGPILRVIDDQGVARDHADIAISWGEGPITIDTALPEDEQLTIWGNNRIIIGQQGRDRFQTGVGNIEVTANVSGDVTILSGKGAGTPNFQFFTEYYDVTFSGMTNAENDGTFLVLNTGRISEGVDAGRTYIVIQNPDSVVEVNTATNVTVSQDLPDFQIASLGLYSSVKHYDGTQTEPDEILRRLVGSKFIPSYEGIAYTVFQKMRFYPWLNQIPNFMAEIRHADNPGVAPEQESLGSAIERILVQSDVDSALYDTSELTQQVRGYFSRDETTGEDTISDLLEVFEFRIVEYDGTITFKRREDVDTVEITDEGEFGSHLSGSDAPRKVEFVEETVDRLPKMLSLGFQDPVNMYQRSEVKAHRNLKVAGQTPNGTNANAFIESRTHEPRDTLVVLLENEARSLAERMLDATRDNRAAVVFQLPPSRLDIVPGDEIDATIDGTRYNFLVETMERGANFLVQCTGILQVALRNSGFKPQAEPVFHDGWGFFEPSLTLGP